MTCPLCPQKLTYDSIRLLSKACPSCEKQVKQMLAGFNGVMTTHKSPKTIWDNSIAYNEWLLSLKENDKEPVKLSKNAQYVEQRCDIRDMKRIVGIPKFLPLEEQVFTAWILDGTKDERMQEVLGLTYSQLFQIKKIVKYRLQKQMAYYHQIKKLEKEGKSDATR